MKPLLVTPAAIAQPAPQSLTLSGCWSARGIGSLEQQLESLRIAAGTQLVVDGTQVEVLDTAGAWLLQKLLLRLRAEGVSVTMHGLRPQFARLLEDIAQHVVDQNRDPATVARRAPTVLARLGQSATAAFGQGAALLGFVGESALALAGCVAHPERLRWRPILYNIRSAGFDALPIVGPIAAGQDINRTMVRRRMNPDVQRQWEAVRGELNRLAEAFELPRIRW